jgi:hypothetical protein
VAITVVITSKTQIKEKRTENKTMGYLLRVLFFNAFELSAERWKSSIFERSIKINCFLKITTYHTRHFRGSQR